MSTPQKPAADLTIGDRILWIDADDNTADITDIDRSMDSLTHTLIAYRDGAGEYAEQWITFDDDRTVYLAS